VTGSGWIEPNHYPFGDRYLLLSSGPFNMETWTDTNGDGRPQPGEPGVQEVVCAIIIAPGSDHIQAIANLRNVTRFVRATHRYADNRPYMTITNPQADATYSNSVSIQWINDPAYPLAQIIVPQYSSDGGFRWQSIDTLFSNEGSYQWQVADRDMAYASVRLLGFAQDPNNYISEPIKNGVIHLPNFGVSNVGGPFCVDNLSIDDPPQIGNLRQDYCYRVNISGDFPLQWQILDAEKQFLNATLEMKNHYEDWQSIEIKLPLQPGWVFPSAKFPNSEQTYLRLKVSDGANQVVTEFPHVFTIKNERKHQVPLEHISGGANSVIVQVAQIDSTQINNHQYEIHFQEGSPKTFSVFDRNLNVNVIANLHILDRNYESPIFDGLAVTIEDYPAIAYFAARSGWRSGNCNWVFNFTSEKGRLYPAEYEIRFTSNGSLDINGQQAPFEVWNISENRQSQFTWQYQTGVKHIIGIYEFYVDTIKMVWVGTIVAPTGQPSIPPQPGNILHYYVTVPLTSKDVYQFINSYVAINDKPPVPANFHFFPAYPNPFNPQTTLKFQLSYDSMVEMQIYNLVGQLVQTLIRENKPAGTHSVVWNAGNLPSGIYFIRMTAGNFHKVQKCILLK